MTMLDPLLPVNIILLNRDVRKEHGGNTTPQLHWSGRVGLFGGRTYIQVNPSSFKHLTPDGAILGVQRAYVDCESTNGEPLRLVSSVDIIEMLVFCAKNINNS
jgi:hypothetical protein